ncbi:MAG: hypothetical protein A2341_18500 [Deltaproteobacteria bacterium RIFOXYB12_FULL_58_9]|nr:MAG: hypothetical protein A2341_18500 [Deltaproteobacteria bacterium RIFOXYB12_FULL_58_9]
MEMTYKQYFEAMPCYVTVQDRDLRVIDGNDRFREHFGDWDGRYCYQLYKNRSEPCEQCPVARTFDDGEAHRSEQLVTNLDGREISLAVFTTPIKNDKGEVTQVLEMSADITEIKRLQRQLKESQERYRLLFEEVPCYISIQDKDLRIVEANRRFREDFGQFLGCKCYKTYKHRDEECLHCPVQETFTDGGVHTSEEVVTALNGDQINTLAYSAPILGDDGQIKYVMEMSTNITPIRELQTQLESMGTIISSISHGIKGMLTGLDGGTYLVNSGMAKDKPERVAEGWDMVQRNVERIRGMVMNILYYAKDRQPNWECLGVSDVVLDVVKTMTAKAERHKVELQHDIQLAAGTFEADPQAIRALLVNLVENSLDACGADRKKDSHWVKMSTRGFTDHVEIEVADNGIGMDQEIREKAFTKFFSSKGMAGTGLGLFISGNIAKRHGGDIDLESEPGRGTRFVVKLPRSRPRDPVSLVAAATG